MARLLYGKEVNKALNEELKGRIAALEKTGIQPAAAVLRVGCREDQAAYERALRKRCSALGIRLEIFELPEDTGTDGVIGEIRRLNEDPSFHGILLMRPFPAGIDTEAVYMALDPAKDIDGVTDGSLAGVFCGTKRGYPPCTPAACMEILKFYGYDPDGRHAVVIGRSLVVGRPMAMMLLKAGATVTICDTRTPDLNAILRGADIIVSATGCAGLVTADGMREGQVILDVGINVMPDGSICGDVAASDAERLAEAYTPVPGGVGNVTVATLIQHIVEAAEAGRKGSL